MVIQINQLCKFQHTYFTTKFPSTFRKLQRLRILIFYFLNCLTNNFSSPATYFKDIPAHSLFTTHPLACVKTKPNHRQHIYASAEDRMIRDALRSKRSMDCLEFVEERGCLVKTPPLVHLLAINWVEEEGHQFPHE